MRKVDLLIRNCTIVPMNGGPFVEKGLIAVRDEVIEYVGRASKAPPFKAEEMINAEGKAALPGLINCHTHVPMTLFRGVAEDKELSIWLKEAIWPLEAKLKPDDVYYGALLGCLEMIKGGTTCFADMYFYEDAVAKAVEESGIRAVISAAVIEAGDPSVGEAMLKGSIEIAKDLHGRADGRVITRLGPHAVYTCSPELLMRVREAASKLGVGVHIHLAESKEMLDLVKRRYGLTEVELLKNIGFLGPDVLAAHCIHLSSEDIKTLAVHNVKIAYNPISNMKLAQGIAKVKDLLEAGVTVGLGTNGPASNNTLDMFQSLKVGALLQKASYEDPRAITAYQALKMATIDAAKALALDDIIGSLEVGKRADIILIDLKKPHLAPLHNIYANIVYSTYGSDVDIVIVDGRIIMRDRNVITLNEEEVIRKANEAAMDLIKR